MNPSAQSDNNPLGLNLDFMFGRGYLWSERHRLADWIAIESLRMEIPDLEFPFDARGGLDRFQHTRCLVRDLEVSISEVGLGELLREAAGDLKGFDDLQIRFLEDAAHVSLRLDSFGADTFVSFRAALIVPEPARADELHLSLYDYRAYGPLPYPARLVVHELLTELLESPVFRVPGRGESFSVGVAGDIVRFRPLKLLLLNVFPEVGWKLPSLSGVVLEYARIRPGVLTIRAVDETPESGSRPGRKDREESSHELAASAEGARALAAYEAKELFAHADRALFDGDIDQALSLLSNYRDAYGLHPALIARLLDCLVANASPANLAEAESIRRELVEEDPDDLRAALAAPIIALARRRDDEALEAFEDLADRLRDRGDTRDWMLCELAVADFVADDDPDQAARRLEQVLKRDPQHRAALERLRDIYERIDGRAGLEETLKRLTGVYSDRQRLVETYLELARHLMDREGELSEARMYLEKVLRIDDNHLEALRSLGESYMLGDQPLRALKAFGSAARTAESRERPRQAGRLFLRAGRLWDDEMEDDRQALLAFQRALTSFEATPEAGDDDRVEALVSAAEASEKLGRDEDAVDYWSDALQLIQRHAGAQTEDREQTPGELDWRGRLVEARRHLGRLYDRRDRSSAAARHFRRILEVIPGDQEAIEWLDGHLRQGGRPDDLVELYEDQIDEIDDQQVRLEFVERLGDLYADLDLPEEATRWYRQILEADPDRGDVRDRLAELLVDHQRFETLTRILRTARDESRDRQTHFEISTRLGEAAEAVGELEEAVQLYHEAARLRAGDREALEKCCRLLREFVDRHGRSAEAPVGESTAGRLLEEMLVRLAEVVPSAAREREVLSEVAECAEARGDSAAAAEARRRAEALKSPTERGEFGDVDERLDSMLDGLVDNEEPRQPESSPRGPVSKSSVEDLPEPDGDEWNDPRQRAETTRIPIPEPDSESESESEETTGDSGLPRPDHLELGGTGSDDGDEGKADDEVESFRRRFASMKQRPSQLPDPGELEDKSTLEASGDDEPETIRMSVDEVDTLREESSDPQLVDETDDGEIDDGETDGGDEHGGWSLSFSESPPDGESDRDTSPDIDPLEMAREGLEEARAGGDDPREIAESIEHLLALAEDEDTDVLENEELIRLSRELGELLYYELDEETAARSHLERVRRLEPEGRGSDPEVLNALESLYERDGDVDSRIRLLEARLQEADSPDMKVTYRLLVAQAHWNEQDDAEAARRRLDEVLELDDGHEGAHRLLADIAEDQGRLEDAARHLETVVDVSSGGLDTVETRRRLASLLLNEVDAPGRAADHFQQVLEASPGDARALEGVKEARAALGDWEGYIEGLGRELGLLVGDPEGLGPDEMATLSPSEVDDEIQVPASRITADAAHIADREIEDLELARRLWGAAVDLWPEHAEALQRRIELDRQCQKPRALAEDLEAYARLVLDDGERLESLVEAADIRAEQLDDPDRAGSLYDEALAIAEETEQPTEDVDEIRRALDRLDE